MNELPLVPLADADPGRTAVEMPDGNLTYAALLERVHDVAAAVSSAVAGVRRTRESDGADRPNVVAVPAVASIDTVVGLLGALAAGVAVVPVNTGAGPDELSHVVADSRPDAVVAPPGVELPGPLTTLARAWDGPGQRGSHAGARAQAAPGDAALVVYTSGTTGPPKGVVLSHGALAADLDALATAWELDATDVLVHALPLFHVHGLVLATLGPLRIGATTRHIGRFQPSAVASHLDAGATVHYGVPTMYHRLADAIDDDQSIARSLARARLLVSGSAGLAAHDRNRISAATGSTVIERYGMTETLITCAARASGPAEPGTVGPPLPGVDLRLVDDAGAPIAGSEHGTVGEIHVRGATLFDGYLGRPDATAACFTSDGWFRTGDLATWAPGGALRIAGRRSVDLIKSGGYRIGAGEIENVLLTHPSVAEVAVTGEPDPDLGERIVAWVVPVRGSSPSESDLVAHVAEHLAGHKRPRRIQFLERLPRNELGKVLKRSLG